MSLLCSFGRHRPGALPRWNDGFYFTRCERCGRDLVRTAFTSWHVPEGYRVVWSATPPAERPDVALIPQPALPEVTSPPHVPVEPLAAPPEPAPIDEGGPEDPAPPAADREPAEAAAAAPPPEPQIPERAPLPIEQVFKQLRGTPEAGPAGQHEGAAQEPRRPYWDFMEEDGSAARSPVAGEAQTSSTGVPRAADAAERDGLSETVAAVFALARGALGAARGGATRFAQTLRRAGAMPMPLLGFGLALIVTGILAATLAMTTGFHFSSPPAAIPAQPAEPDGGGTAAALGTGRAVNRAYVAARVLSCRDAPARNAQRVRNLGRGTPVDLLGDDGDWLSIAYRGRQCWVQARFLSPLPPY